MLLQLKLSSFVKNQSEKLKSTYISKIANIYMYA